MLSDLSESADWRLNLLKVIPWEVEDMKGGDGGSVYSQLTGCVRLGGTFIEGR